MAARILTALVLIPLVLAGIFYLSDLGVLAVIVVLAFLAGLEWAELIHIGRGGRIAFALLGAGLTGVASGLAPEMIAAAALVWWVLVAAELPLFLAQTDAPVYRAPDALAGLVTLVPALALLGGLITDAPWAAVAVLAAIWAGDTGAYVVGSAFGRHRLAPHISPGKTWEGLIGGALLGGAAGGALAWLAPGLASIPVLSALGAVVVVVGQVGDLFESMVKRRAGRKDSGRWLPGHGGILDRIDSLTAAVPVYTFCLRGIGL